MQTMKTSLVAVVLLCIFGFSLGLKGDYQEKFFDQYIDHFNFASYGEKTYKQRYLIQDRWWRQGHGPILLYTGNEGPINAFADNTGFMFDIAPEFGGLLVFAEHRFYGKSFPFDPEVAFTKPYIGLLTIEQAMADFAMLITHLKVELNSTDCPVIAFGGSYGGMLSAYMRFKYPNIVAGSIAASAPIFLLSPELDRSFFFTDVTKDFGRIRDCVEGVHQAFIEMNMLARQGTTGLEKLSKTFNLCSPLTSNKEYQHLLGWVRNAFTVLAMMDYPYKASTFAALPAFPVKVACGLITNSTEAIFGLAKAVDILYNTVPVKCHNIFQEYVECADPTGCGVGPDSRAWDYQACTEVHLPAGSNNITDMFPVIPFTSQIRTEYCQQKWNVTPRDSWAATQFWGRDLNTASNIVFSNGDLDPWRRGGVLTTTNPNLVTQLVIGGAHHLDLRGANPADPPSVRAVREVEKSQIHKWIMEHYTKSSAHSPVQ
ncbi:dipeptidyl peptidase 2-like [Pecten maximus]|uniref:dipeptidyl peptidase 2-like n=1 Tax=Pecten maximus TaxID=6579 RepID=UPI00145919AC|nr:dipeptidyl peptidase 2-like [Pecten maximus]